MGKTSIVRELGQRLEAKGWIFLFADVEGAASAEDLIADLAQATHPVQPISSRLLAGMRHLFNETVEEVGALDFRVKIRAGLNSANWRRHGEQLLRDCAGQDQRVLLVIDELPIFLNRLLASEDGAKRVDEFLSWPRAVFQGFESRSPILIVSGSIGLQPLVQRLGIPDRINYLDPFRLGPWNRDTCIACFNRLAKNYQSDVLEVLVHDGYLESTDSGFSFPSRLLKEWWAARFRDHYTPLEERWNERD